MSASQSSHNRDTFGAPCQSVANAMAVSSLSDDVAGCAGPRIRKLGQNFNPRLWKHSPKPVQDTEAVMNVIGRSSGAARAWIARFIL